jgi:hypothetical protein
LRLLPLSLGLRGEQIRKTVNIAALDFLAVLLSCKKQLSFALVNCKIAILHNRGSRFLNYNFLQLAVDGKNNSKTKVEKAIFFIFISSYAEMRFLKQKITK